MTDSVPSVVVPHVRFLESQDRRRQRAAQPVEHQSLNTIDLGVEILRAALASRRLPDAAPEADPARTTLAPPDLGPVRT
jgi:hypothetical protein